ncbi:TauD/TfdA family dioxygenase [Mycobacterium sp. 1245111.1]|uniref:TauD/TfdA family dioxygenase n=1 Tax=Mycobacterium sp. 1245111.1 TaxID=1834073 RepID=UPI0009F473DA|nr:TauD/TfdA family dioxygenase [Mycobacterium sp. 1245111.1]
MIKQPSIEDRIRALHSEVRQRGWAVDALDLSYLTGWSSELGWTRISNRLGNNMIDELTPTSETDSHPRSLSAIHGLRTQPLHTDGAHLRRPPDLVAFSASAPNDTPTLLWRPTYPPAFVSHGVFLVDAGSDRFLTTPHSMRSGFRFDPGCMTPIDQRARSAVEFFTDHRATAVVEHHWDTPGQLLLIDNRRVLHARANVSEGDEGRRITRMSFVVAAQNV